MLIEGGHLFDIMALRVGTHWGGERERERVLIWGGEGCSVRRGREGAHLGGKGAQLGGGRRVLI